MTVVRCASIARRSVSTIETSTKAVHAVSAGTAGAQSVNIIEPTRVITLAGRSVISTLLLTHKRIAHGKLAVFSRSQPVNLQLVCRTEHICKLLHSRTVARAAP